MVFRVGQKVACVKIGRGPSWAKHNCLRDAKIGTVYTIREIYLSLEGKPSLHLHEISNPIHPRSGREFGFYATRFRAIVERETDISALTALLVPGTKILEGA